MADATQTDYYQRELTIFNKGFQAYDKKMMYGADVISVVNKAIDNNKKYGGKGYYDPSNLERDYLINIRFEYEGREYSISDENSYKTMNDTWLVNVGKKSSEASSEYNYLIGCRYRCQNVIYNKDDGIVVKGAVGRIKEMIFKQG